MNAYFYRTAIILAFLSFSIPASAQKLKFLIPDAAIVQYAGSIGYFSAGAGYDIFKNKRGSIDIHYGYVPESKGGELNILTAKFAYRPFVIKLKNWGKLYPINPGFFVSYTFDRDLSLHFKESLYPENYYYWSEAVRPHLSFSNELELNAKQLLQHTKIKSLSVYTEFNASDYYLISYAQNYKTLSLTDIFQLGIGLRMKF